MMRRKTDQALHTLSSSSFFLLVVFIQTWDIRTTIMGDGRKHYDYDHHEIMKDNRTDFRIGSVVKYNWRPEYIHIDVGGGMVTPTCTQSFGWIEYLSTQTISSCWS